MALEKWLESGKYLPPFLRDFHDQKDVFKAMHMMIDDNEGTKRVNWVDGQIYVIDVFLWFMARRGWTLQRSRKDLPFLDMDKTVRNAKLLNVMQTNPNVSVNASSTSENEISPPSKGEIEN